MPKNIREQRCSAFSLSEDTFDRIPISMCEHSKSVAVFGRNRAAIASVIDEKLDAIEL